MSQRTAARARGGMAALVAALFLAACGPTSQDQVSPQRYVDPPTISAEADAAYGERAGDAFTQVSDFLLEHSYVEPLIDPTHTQPSEAELTEGIVDAMTPEAATAWLALVTQDLAGDEAARDAVRLLRFHSWNAPKATLASDPVRFQSISEGSVDVGAAPAEGEEQALVIDVVHRAAVTLVESRVPYDVVLTKPIAVTVVPDPQDPTRWIISTFEGTMTLRTGGVDPTDDPDQTDTVEQTLDVDVDVDTATPTG